MPIRVDGLLKVIHSATGSRPRMPHYGYMVLEAVGRPILAAIAIEEVFKSCRQDIIGGYYYCDHGRPETQLLSNVIASLIGQFARQSEKCFDLLKTHYEDYFSDDKFRMPSEAILEDLFIQMSTLVEDVSIIIDGLDESAHDSGNLAQIFASLLSKGKRNIRVLLISRHLHEVRQHLDEFFHLEVAAQPEDLKLYILARLRTPTSVWTAKIKTNEEKELVLARLLDEAHGRSVEQL